MSVSAATLFTKQKWLARAHAQAQGYYPVESNHLVYRWLSLPTKREEGEISIVHFSRSESGWEEKLVPLTPWEKEGEIERLLEDPEALSHVPEWLASDQVVGACLAKQALIAWYEGVFHALREEAEVSSSSDASAVILRRAFLAMLEATSGTGGDYPPDRLPKWRPVRKVWKTADWHILQTVLRSEWGLRLTASPVAGKAILVIPNGTFEEPIGLALGDFYQVLFLRGIVDLELLFAWWERIEAPGLLVPFEEWVLLAISEKPERPSKLENPSV